MQMKMEIATNKAKRNLTHRLLDDLVVVGHVLGINWLSERPACAIRLKKKKYCLA